ncbi:MAG TPA: tetratricopeptide repeat protein [Candidatus Polarisedimenticolia bacterium]
MSGTPSTRSSRLIPLLAILAGASSLCFELLWARMLAIEVGATLAALSIVVATVTLGLALGAERLGRAADRTERPIRVFALCQAGAAAMGLASSLLASLGGLARPQLGWLRIEPGGFPFLATIALTYGAFTCAASFLMGGTLPLLLRGARGRGSFGARAGGIAALNAAGAAAGALLCGFVLLPGAGLRASLMAGVALATLTALAALILDHEVSSIGGVAPPAPGFPPESPRDTASPARPAILAAMLVSGAAVTALEVGWTRVAFYSFGSSAQAGSLVLAAAIAGLALGAGLGARPDRGTRLVSSPSRTLSLFLSGGALAIAAADQLLGRLPLVAAWMGSHALPGTEAAVDLPLDQAARLGLLFGLVCLPSALLGACFPAGCRALQAAGGPVGAREGRDVGLASAACAAGNMLGAPLACFLVLPLAGSRVTLLASAAAMGVAAWFIAPPRTPARRRGALAGRELAVASLTLAAGTGLLLSWDPDLISSGPYLYGPLYESAVGSAGRETIAGAMHARGDLVFFREGADALVTVRRSRDGLLSLQVNGKTDASTGGDLRTQALTAHLPLLLRAAASPPPDRVLVIGLGSGVTAGAALTHPVGSVHIVEISPAVVEASRLFTQANHGALLDPRSTLLVRDVRAHLLFGARGVGAAPARGSDLYDVIASQPSNPWVAGQAILFTREFFSLARGRLAPGGVMCQWVQGQGLAPEDFRSIVSTFAGAFPHVSLWEESTSGGDYLLVGSEDALSLDLPRLGAAMGRAEVAADLARAEIASPADLLSLYVAGDAGIRGFALGSPAQTEDALSLEYSAPAALHRETLGAILGILEPARMDPARLPGVSESLARDLRWRARLARKEREWAAGIGLLSGGLSGADPDLLRAASYLRAGMKEHAMETLRALVLRRPTERTPRLMLAHLLMSFAAAGRPDAAEAAILELRAAVTLEPGDGRARLLLSRALFAAGLSEDALLENRRIPAPISAEAASDRCAMLLAVADDASAEAYCLEAISMDSDLAEAHGNLGVVRARRGRPAEAEASYRRALDLDPDLSDTRFNLGALFERQGRAAEGISVLAPLLDGSHGRADATVLRLAARLAIAAGDRNAARVWLAESMEAEPGSTEAADMERLLEPDRQE